MSFNPMHQIDNLNRVTHLTNEVTTQAFFHNSYGYIWDNANLNAISNLLREYNAEQIHAISFDVPQLFCWGSYQTGVATRLFELNTITRVFEIKTMNRAEVSRSTIVTIDSGATSLPVTDDAVFWGDGQSCGLRSIIDFNYASNTTNWLLPNDLLNAFRLSRHWAVLPILARANTSFSNKTISFTTRQLSISELQAGYQYQYVVECVANPVNSQGLLQYYEKTAMVTTRRTGTLDNGSPIHTTTVSATTTSNSTTDHTRLRVQFGFVCRDTSATAEGGTFLMTGVRYNAYDLLRRALLTCSTHLIDNATTGLDELTAGGIEQPSLQHSIIVDNIWSNRLKSATVHETIFEGKNLWEVLLQLGYYIHAIPYLEFAQDGTDRFVLRFRQLGDTRTKANTTQKITVFTSRNLQDYFTQYDAYVTNLFSPQNVVEEFIVPKTSSREYLVYNDTAELIVSKPIMELVELDVTYDGHAGGRSGTVSILEYVFEQSIYDILTSENPGRVVPAKGNSLYYTLMGNKIQGLQYVPPSVNPGAMQYSLQEIIRRRSGQNYP